jgi:hypothetical protein
MYLTKRITMRTFTHLLPVSILCVILSCCEQSAELPNPLDVEKDYAVRLTIDWSNRSQGVAAPPHYTVRTGELHLSEISGTTFVIPHKFQPGQHSIYVYNPVSNVSVDGTTASLDVENGYLKALPGWFFTSAYHITVEEGKTYSISSVMQQQVRELKFILLTTAEAAGKVSDIEASFNGVASQLDIRNGDLTGSVSVRLDFTRSSDTTFVASTRIPGIIGDTQLLMCRMNFDDPSLPETSKLYELHYILENFNADKITPATVFIAIIPDRGSWGI